MPGTKKVASIRRGTCFNGWRRLPCWPFHSDWYRLLIKKNSLVSYFHFFPGKLNITNSDSSFEHGKYTSATLAILFQVRFSERETKGMFLAGGAALQKTSENYVSNIEEIHLKRLIMVAALRIGHLFPVGSKTLSVEFNALGPHKSTTGTPPYTTQLKEILTQLSFGARIIF